MTLRPVDAGFVAAVAAERGEDLFRPVSERYLEEPRGRWAGQASALALPRNAQDVAALVRHAAAARVPVVPYGGGTGLVSGQVQTDGPAPLLVSLERMNAVRDVYPDEFVLIAEAGVTLAGVQEAAASANRLFPLSLGSEGTARIGGNLSTNAGGTAVLRYGNARDLCLGLEAVLPDGQIWHGLTRLRKDNTGYDLRNLLIGAEGTLGIITAATLKLFPRPAETATALLVVPDPRAALLLLGLARETLGDAVSAFELMHGVGFEMLAETLPQVRRPFDPAPEWCVLVELGMGAGQADPALADLFAAAFEAGFVLDGLIAQSQTQAAEFWTVREQIPEANRKTGAVSSHDISLPLGVLPDFIQRGGEIVAGLGPYRVNCFGHVGDGNLHYNVFPPRGETVADHEHQRDAVKRAVHDLVHEMGGSVSAEHGIGRMKVGDLERYGDPTKLAAMRAIKSALDPAGIMNPGAVLRL